MGLTTTRDLSPQQPFPAPPNCSCFLPMEQLLKLISDCVQKHGFSPIAFLLATVGVQDKLLQDVPLWSADCFEQKTTLAVGSRETSDP